MHKMTFFPLGNADCCRIDLENGKKILFDYADMRDPEDDEDLRCDLPRELRDDLEENKRDYYDVVAFTHLDKDHCTGFSDFFYLEHAPKYQSDDRIKINIMWVPAAIITETGIDEPEGRILRAEARYRFKKGEGIRVFSRPEQLKNWCEENNVKLEDRNNIITDAGKVAPELSLDSDKIEFFVHSPFAFRQDQKPIEDRNGNCIVMQATFKIDDIQTKALLMGDIEHEPLSNIVDITNFHKNDIRLEWDIVKLPHHCSYLSLGPDKGVDKTMPTKQISRLYKEQGQRGGIMVSSSKPIPAKGTDEDEDVQPPHRQAAAYYNELAGYHDGEFIVTMEHPKNSSPKPLVIEIGNRKASVKRSITSAGGAALGQRAPRAG